MSKLLRASILIAVALAIPAIPFLLFGERIDRLVEGWLTPPPARWLIFCLVVGVLAADIVLPVPSSLVSTLAGSELGIPLGTLASWIGMTAGAAIGFALARALGRPLAQRPAGPEELARMERLSERFGPRVLVLFRALPILAEASVLLFGVTRLSWTRFLVPVALANLGIALAYSILGHYGRTEHMLVYVLAASIALPLLATTIVRWAMPGEPAS
jgi:uncharacterized membrane protein YdjX (TVP38/TMEM64 family)